MKVLKFQASWCGPCQALSMTLSEAEEGAILIEPVDIDENMEMARKYGVRSVPTLVLVDDAGVEVRRSVGAVTLEAYKAWLAE
jgi:thioredoxin 1